VITVSAQIGTPRGVPDSGSISLDSGVSVKGAPPKSNFHNVLEQYHAERENVSKTDDAKQTAEPNQKDSDAATTLAVPQPLVSMEAPRLILPFTTSITLRQDATTAPNDAASLDTTAVEESTAAAPNSQSKSGLHPATTHPKTETKPNSEPKDIVQSETSAAQIVPSALLPETTPANPSKPIQVASSSTLEQATTVLGNSSMVTEAAYTGAASTSHRATAYQYHPSKERPAETVNIKRPSQAEPKISVPIPAAAAATAVPVQLIHPASSSSTLREGLKALDNGSVVPQDSSIPTGADSKNILPPAIEPTDSTTTGSNAGDLAFAAKLTPTPAPESTPPTEPEPSSPIPPQTTAPVTVKQISIGAGLPADAHSAEGEGQSDKGKANDVFAKPETSLPQMHTPVADHAVIPANNHVSPSPLSPAAQMAHVIEPPTAAPKTNNDITVRIPDSTDQGTAVRFVERAGEIHVSVRTGDVEMAQSLRGGLNELVNHLQDGGMRTEVWQPGAGSSSTFSQNDSHHPFADPDGSNGGQYSSGSNAEQESKQQTRPRWVEELEGSIGNPNFKETTNLLWQA